MSSLSHAQQRLVCLLQEIEFGRIEDMIVYNGNPVFEPAPRILRTFKLGSDTSPQRKPASEDFVLKKQVNQMIEHLSRLGTGTVAAIDVKHGLPCSMVVEQPEVNRGEK